MKFVILMVSAAAAGALSMLLVSTTIVRSGAEELRQIHIADLNPLRLIFDYEPQQIRVGMSPEQLGGHASAVTATPVPLASPPSLKLDLGQAYQAQAQSQIDQGIRRTQDMSAYTNNPSARSGPPPD